MNELALFAGAGGGILAGCLLGWNTVCACEIEPYPRRVLLHNQQLGLLPHFPIWDDIRTFDGTPWRGKVDIVTGGFPCQDISAAGKGAGITGTRSGLWTEMHRIIREIRPRYAFMENSPMLTSRGLGRVLGDLAEIGYHAAWCVLGAADCGAPHRRDRIWILAVRNTDCKHEAKKQALPGGSEQTPQPGRSCGAGDNVGRAVAHPHGAGRHAQQHEAGIPCQTLAQTPEQQPGGTSRGAHPVPHPTCLRCQEQRRPRPAETPIPPAERNSWWRSEPRVGRVAHGVANRVDRLKSLGNGQVPLVAATAFQILKHRLDNTISST